MIINPENYFYLQDGSVLKDMYEMLDSMNKMPDEVFLHHVSTEKNDFYNWTKEVLKDGVLARKMTLAKTKEQMADAIQRRIREISKVKNKKKVIEQIKEACLNEQS